MNFRTTIVLLLLLVIAGTVLMLTRGHPLTKPAETSGVEGAALIDLPSATISKLSITASGEKPIELSRDGIKWNLTSPVSGRADSGPVTQLIDDLLALRSSGKLDANTSDTGLDSPRFTVEIGSNERSLKLTFGQRTASGDRVYIRREGESETQIVSGAILDALDRPASIYRQKQLFDVSLTQVQQLSITSGGSTLKLVRDGAKWRITSPVQLDGDVSEVNDLLLAVTNLSATNFAAEKVDDPKRRRLDPAILDATFSTQAPTTAPSTQSSAVVHSVKFGAFSDVSKNAVYASTSDSPALVTIAASAMDALKKTPLDLRDRNLMSIDPNQVQSVSISIDRAATTQPTTQETSHHEEIIERTKDANKQASSAPSSAPSTAPSTVPATKPARKWVVSNGDSKSPVEDSSIDALLTMLHPLRVEKYFASNPTTQSSERISLTIKTVAPGGASATHAFEFTIPVGGGMARGAYNDAAFEPARELIDAIQQLIEPRAHRASELPEDETPLPPTGR